MSVSSSFLDALMAHIMEGNRIPKVQVERVLGPILGLFLEDLLPRALRDDPELSGPLSLICPEFPLKKSHNNQSTNIDWLLHNPERGQLVFLELKTAPKSVNAEQSATYREKQAMIRAEGGGFLIEDLKLVGGVSMEHSKYGFVLRHSFSDLPESIPGPFAGEWQIIRSYLVTLDLPGQQPTASGAAKWQGELNFLDMVGLCAQHGDAVIVGFYGGRGAFLTQSLESLKVRRYKWDYAVNTGGKKLSNWLPGIGVLEVLRSHHGYPADLA